MSERKRTGPREGSAGIAALLVSCGTLDAFETPAPCPPAQPRCHNRAPVAPRVRIEPAEPTAVDTLTCVLEAAASDPDGDGLTLEFGWHRDGELLETATATAGPLREGESWTCAVTASDGLARTGAESARVQVGRAELPALESWLVTQSGGVCCDVYNRLVNLCGPVEFCFDPRIMRAYPAGLAVDVGVHWDGESGQLLDLGGDCDDKRVTIWLHADGTISADFLGPPTLRGPIRPGTRLVSYRAGPRGRALFVDGELLDAAGPAAKSTELLGSCGPGFILGQRLSYWWEENKRSQWLRQAPFFVHLRAESGDPTRFDVAEALNRGPATVARFTAEGVDGERWSSDDGAFVGTSTGGAVWVDDAFAGCLSGNRAPRAPKVVLEPRQPSEGQEVFCRLEDPAEDPDGDVVQHRYLWLEDGAPTDFVAARLPAGVTRAFERWTCRVTPSDGALDGPSAEVGAGIHALAPCHQIALTSTQASIAIESPGYDLGAGPWTVELWIRLRDPAAGQLVFDSGETGENSLVVAVDSGVVGISTYSTPVGAVGGPSERIDDGAWRHVAASHDGAGEFQLFTDGRPTLRRTGTIPVLRSGLARIGANPRRPFERVALVDLGPFRISRVARYAERFPPARRWAADADTVSLFLAERGLEGVTLVDEAGGDNQGEVRRDVEAKTGVCR